MAKNFKIWRALHTLENEVWLWINREDIYLSKTPWVLDTESDAIKYWVQKIITEIWSVLNLSDFWAFDMGNWPYASTQWYQNQAMIDRDTWLWLQACAIKIDNLLRDEPYQKNKPHYDFFLVDKDLTIEWESSNKFIFWLWPYPNNIVSVTRFREYIKDDVLRLISLSILWAHEVWHNFDLVNRNFNTWSEWYNIWHCMWESGPCLMQQVNVWGKTVDQLAREIIDKESWLCIDCTKEITVKKEYLSWKWIQF